MRKLASTSYIVVMCQNMFVRFNKRYSRNKYWTITGNFCARNVRDIYYSNERLLSQSDHRDLPGDLSRNLEETSVLAVLILASLLSSFVRKEIREDVIFPLTFVFDSWHAFCGAIYVYCRHSLDPSC